MRAHVSVLGAGALGRVFAARLAQRAKVDVELVVRASHSQRTAIRIENVDSAESDTIAQPVWTESVAPHADVVLVCVPSDRLDEVAAEHFVRTSAPLVVMCPMLSHTYARLRAQVGERLVAAMSSVTGYVDDRGVTRYWLSRAAKTLVDESPGRPNDPGVTALVGALVTAGIDARFELGVHETNPATTIAFLPLTLALDAAGSSDALLGDAQLLEVTFRACDEARAIGQRVGKIATWAGLLTRFIGPLTLRIGVNLAKKRSPEAVRFVEGHFGRKVHAQNLAMAMETIAIAEERGARHEAMVALLSRVRAH